MRKFKLQTANKISISLVKRAIALLIFVALLLTVISPVSSIARTNDRKVVRVGWYESPYCYTDKFGRRTGIAYEYQQKIAAYTGWTYEYVEGTWPELFQKLIEGKIDILSDVSYKKDREKYMLFPTVPMGTESYYFYIKAGNTDLTIDDFNTFSDKKFAVNGGSYQEGLLRDWAEENRINIDIFEVKEESQEECIEKLRKGEFDVYVAVDMIGNDDVCSTIYKLGASEYYFAVNNRRSDLLKELNYAMNAVQNADPYYNQRLYRKYIWSVKTNSYLSKDEIAWLSGHETVRVGYRDNYLPFCIQNEDGVSGALKDYLDEASTCVNNYEIKFEAIPYKTTEEALKALEIGEIDAVFPMSLNPYESEEMDLFVTDSMMDMDIYAVVKNAGKNYIFETDELTVVLLKGNVNFDSFVKDKFPKWNIIWRDTLDEVYAAVAEGDADCAMVNGYRINTTDRLRRKNNLSVLATGQQMEFSMAVRRKDLTLYSILNKVIHLIEEPTVDMMLSRYSANNEKISFTDYVNDNWESVLLVLVAVSILIVVLILQILEADMRAKDRQRLIKATEHDGLTKLYTRNFFFEYAGRMYKEKTDFRGDAIVLNIEQFHIVNALYGWEFGDTILRALGDEITRFIEENGGIACRSSADRFDIYCDHIEDYQKVFDRLQKSLNACSSNVSIRLRMGVMPWQKDIEPVQLFDRARTACGMVRGGQFSRLMVFNEEMRERELLDQKLLNDLKRAIDNNEFIVYYQPKYDVQANPPVLSSAEALVRWSHPELGMVPPGEFISLFEKNGQISEIDKYVWREAAKQVAKWKEKFGITIPVSVNLSRMDIFDPDLEDIIDGMIKANGILRQDLHLEVTESAYTENADHIINVVSRLKAKGYKIEMDDFGTGYSSLNMLTQMPIDILKLDRSFIKNIDESGKDEKEVRMVELILDIAKNLKLTVVAEGVENDKQLDFLKTRGCNLIQGYYFSPPVPEEKFEKMIKV